jgi:dCMP deaminase
MSRIRASWDEYFMAIAREVATRSTCDRKHVGAVIVRDKMILATGYNGSIRGLPHCDDEGHMMEDGHCVRTVHAEANAIVQAARNGVRLEGGNIYVTASPCFGCFKMIANAGLSRIVFGEFYRDPRIFELGEALGIGLSHLPAGTPAP